MEKMKMLFIYARPWSFPMSIISVLIGIMYSYTVTHSLEALKYLIVIIGALCFHASVNLWNDYFDYKRNIDFAGSPTTVYRPHPIVTGGLSTKGTYIYALSSSLVGLILGVLIYLVWGNVWGPIFGVIGFLLAYIYSGSFLATKYRALGEVEVFIAWGLLFSLGAYAIVTGGLSVRPMVLSMPFGLLVSAVLTANNTRDIEYDSSKGVKTLSIILGKERSLRLLEGEVISAYLLTLALVATGVASPFVLLSLISLPKAVKVLKGFRREVPVNADPVVAGIAIQFGVLYLAGLALSTVF